LAFLDPPAGFQLNAAQLSHSFLHYFKKNFSLDVAIARFRTDADSAASAVAILQTSNYLIAGPGSPTYAITHWRDTTVYQTLIDRLNVGAQIVLASSATIAISRYALPVYEIHKVGETPHWVEGLNLLEPHGLDLAIIPHYDNKEGRTYDTRYCFMGEPRLLALEKLLPDSTVILGIDENTACTLDLEKKIVSVIGAGRVTIRYKGKEQHYREGDSFPFERLTPAHAAEAKFQTPNSKSQNPEIPNLQSLYVPSRIIEWAKERDQLRAEKKFAESDHLRDRIANVGYTIKDSPTGATFSLHRYAKPSDVPSQLEKPVSLDWSVNLLAHNNRAEIIRAAQSVLKWRRESIEVIIVDNGSTDDTLEGIVDLACDDDRLRPIFLANDLGEGAGRNAGLRASRGKHVMILGGHIELNGDAFTPLAASLADERVGASGSNGLVSEDLFTFNPAPTSDCDAIEFYLFAFKRDRLNHVGMLDEKFVFYRNIDLDWSMAFKDKGLRLMTIPQLPITIYEHPYLRMNPDERDRLSKKNYKRFLEKWRERKDLLIHSRIP
ncbi:MAG: glycosyltransferase, partial [Chloroflexi bacterium]|nr:glycosyltransferase [Chloroflexota bacterium]